MLKIGQILKIPREEVGETGDYIVYTVQPGDSLYSIAREYGLTVDELIDYNNLSSTNLSINQQILIPKKTETAPGETNTYTVKSGDTLYSIARQFNTTINELMTLNNLTTSVLSVGQTLRIPDDSTTGDYVEYIVKSGDSLYIIANKYGTTFNAIKSANNLTSNLLSIGQVLKIPKSGETITYTVKSGDNLYSIANKYNTTVDEIKRKNNLSSNLLSVGQILVI